MADHLKALAEQIGALPKLKAAYGKPWVLLDDVLAALVQAQPEAATVDQLRWAFNAGHESAESEPDEDKAWAAYADSSGNVRRARQPEAECTRCAEPRVKRECASCEKKLQSMCTICRYEMAEAQLAEQAATIARLNAERDYLIATIRERDSSAAWQRAKLTAAEQRAERALKERDGQHAAIVALCDLFPGPVDPELSALEYLDQCVRALHPQEREPVSMPADRTAQIQKAIDADDSCIAAGQERETPQAEPTRGAIVNRPPNAASYDDPRTWAKGAEPVAPPCPSCGHDHPPGRKCNTKLETAGFFCVCTSRRSRVPTPEPQAEPGGVTPDPNRCAVCGWTLAASIDKGCTRGNCSLRPFPSRFYDASRAAVEYRLPVYSGPWGDRFEAPAPRTGQPETPENPT